MKNLAISDEVMIVDLRQRLDGWRERHFPLEAYSAGEIAFAGHETASSPLGFRFADKR